jgi:hypothetical protein
MGSDWEFDEDETLQVTSLDELEFSLNQENDSLQNAIEELQQKQIEVEELIENIDEMDLDEFIGHVAMATSEDDQEMAAREIIDSMAASQVRAEYCASFGNSRLSFSGETFVARLFGQAVNEDLWIDLAQRTVSFVGIDSRDHGTMKLRQFEQPAEDLWEYLKEEDVFSDSTSSLASAVLASGVLRDPEEIVKLMPNVLPYDSDAIEDLETKMLSSIYSFLCLREGGLVFSEGRIETDYSDEIVLNSPWILPFSADSSTKGLGILLDSISELGLAICSPEDDLFSFDPSPDWVEDVRNTAAFLYPQLIRPITEVSYFSSNKIQILLVERDNFVYAWVGINDIGIIFGFDPESFVVVGMPSPAMATAVGCAISFYVDRKIRFHREIPGTLTTEVHQYRGRHSLHQYLPQPSFNRNITDVARGQHAPPRAHYVAPHIRHLNYGRPNPAHVALAPTQLRIRMGHGDTWVNGHARGSNNIGEIMYRLSRYSMLADSLGQLS